MDKLTNKHVEQLAREHTLPLESYEHLVANQSPQAAAALAAHAAAQRQALYGNGVFIRGLIEVSSYCKNDCYYCGIRASNASCERFRLSDEQILECADTGYDLGFRTFVLQGGEDLVLSEERVASLIRTIKERHPDCAITLSLGERPRETYAAWRAAGADRYLLRHEAADPGYYAQLHPSSMDQAHRMECLQNLRDLGFATGAGFMVGAPGQTPAHIAADLKFIEEFKPEMCGIGPFVPHHATPYAAEPAGTLEQTCYLLSIIRLIHPPILLPATTALGTIAEGGRERGIAAGANVVMPNLSPADTRAKYEIYDNKLATGVESAEGLAELNERFQAIGYHVVVDRGDPAVTQSSATTQNETGKKECWAHYDTRSQKKFSVKPSLN